MVPGQLAVLENWKLSHFSRTNTHTIRLGGTSGAVFIGKSLLDLQNKTNRFPMLLL